MALGSRLSILFLLGVSLAPAGSPLTGPLPARPDETCVVCGRAVGASGAAYLYEGQRLPVCERDRRLLVADPETYAASSRPNNMIMNPRAAGGLSGTWLWIGVYVLAGLVFGSLASLAALAQGRGPLAAFLLGFLFTVPGYLYVLSRGRLPGAAAFPAGRFKQPGTQDPVKCPACGSTNHPAARRCSACGNTLEPAARSESEAVREH